MALPVNIENLVNGESVEWERLEFKGGWNPEEVVHTLCAFANDINNWGGGYIIIGVGEQDGRPMLPPVGLPHNQLDAIQKKIVELSHQLQPNYLPIVQPYVLMRQHILVIWAPAGDLRPYTAPSTQGGKAQRQYYIRSGTSSVVPKGPLMQQLIDLTARIPFDDRINQQASVTDLNLGLMRAYLQEVGSDLFYESIRLELETLARQMQLVRGPVEFTRPVNVGLLFFHSEPHRFFPRCQLDVVIHQNREGRNFTEKIFRGPLHVQLRESLAYIQTNVLAERVEKISGQAEAYRFVNFPYQALEEALSNAVYHRAYDDLSPIEVQVFPDSIQILSFPGPVPPVDNQALQQERVLARNYRNRRIGDLLKELRLAEGRGTGLPIIRQTMIRNGSPNPRFETDADRTYFMTVLPVHPAWLRNSVQAGVQAGVQAEVVDTQGVSAEGLAVLRAATQPRTRRELLETVLHLSNHPKNATKHLFPLLQAELLTRTMPDSPSSPLQRYVLTERGHLVLQLLENSDHR